MLRKLTFSLISSKNDNLFRLLSSKPPNKLTPPNGLNNSEIPIVDFNDPDHLPLPIYPAKVNEALTQKKQRLLYQSRKRGMLENDLILSTFAAEHLNSFNEKQTTLYDQLINGVTNDWDIYYWATGIKPTPQEYDNEIMNLLKHHVKNVDKKVRIRQPDL